MEKRKYVIDFAGCDSPLSLFSQIQTGFDEAPEGFGHNRDALWDVLTGYIDDSAIIELHGVYDVSEELKGLMQLILNVFWEAEHELKGYGMEVRIIG